MAAYRGRSTWSLDAVKQRHAWTSLRTALLIAVLLGAPLTASSNPEPPGLREAIARHENAQAAIARRLYNPNYPDADPESYTFRFALADLNGDGILDAIVYFDGPDSCGTGGCALEIYRGTVSGFEYVSGTLLIFPPIRILPEHRYGWATLIVRSRYVGDALLRYNGKRYPSPDKLKATPAQIQAARIVVE
jgi:hypothetical protein